MQCTEGHGYHREDILVFLMKRMQMEMSMEKHIDFGHVIVDSDKMAWKGKKDRLRGTYQMGRRDSDPLTTQMYVCLYTLHLVFLPLTFNSGYDFSTDISICILFMRNTNISSL